MEKLIKSDRAWREKLTPEQYRVLREKGTERAFTGAYSDAKSPGIYRCAGCGLPLFRSDAKYDSGSGWPSFWKPIAPQHVELHADANLGMERIEVSCVRCGGHLGHVSDDGPTPTGKRYCINSAALDLAEEEPDRNEEIGDG
ncbi:peptide-methionine (R)-S-oxide reductase MsrB [Candidatus Bipolaricaulota bacterium]|nr:peptide-methionine (R)-S-oxide reductase MsrB [Candidatus Bipolaricaulota bacterium]